MIKRFNLISKASREEFHAWIMDALKYEDKLTVTVEKYRKKRSTDSNAYYWSVCIPPLAEHFGYRPEEMHTVLLGTYTGWQQRTFRGQTIYVPQRTSTTPDVMSTIDFQGLVQLAQQIAAEEGVILPDQEEK